MKRHKMKIRKRELEGGEPAHKAHNCSRNYDWLKLVIITVLAAGPYIPSLDGEFVFDDSATIINNPVVTGKTPLKQVFTTDYWGHPIASPLSHKSYRPLTTLTFWLNYRFHNEWTLPYHLLNIALHAIASLLVFLLVRKLHYVTEQSFICDEAFVASALFAVHPVHTEAVANITGRAELLMSVFALFALICYQKHIQKDFEGKAIILFPVTVVLSVFSKEQGITVLPVCIFLEVLRCFHTGRKYAAAPLRCFMLFIFTSTLTFLRIYINNYTAPKFTELDNPAAFVKDPLLRVASYSYLCLINLRLLLLPYSLCFDYSMGCVPPITSWNDYRVLSLPAVAFFLIVILYILHELDNRLSTFGAVLGGISFLPASNLLITVGFTVAERVLYLPSVGFCIMVGVLYSRALGHYRNMDKIALAVLVIAMTITYQRCEEWRTEVDLYASGLRVCPENAKIHYNLGKVLSKTGNVDAAEHNYWNAIRLNPSYEHALNNLANILESKGRSADAEHLLRQAIRKRPTFAVAWMNLGITLMNQGKYQESLGAYRKSLHLRPNNVDCLFNLGNLYQRISQPLNALDAWRNATRLDPNHSQAVTNLLVLLDELGRCDDVLETAKTLSEAILRDVASIAFQVGICSGKNGSFLEAEWHLKRALQLSPLNAMYHANLGVLYQRWARYELAECYYRESLLLERSELVKQNLIAVLQKLNRTTTKVERKDFVGQLGCLALH
ncbi:unnamed protein product [Cylicocyclus nassatus]|uniref:dolichyl-phosphate-mannose--protein mannosyltransferase n=1 Tax=Cylicocyclus nassatus TaxID=53992 RepID=A0AA36DV97_CYLNA|nr:unnamed protein product [Cylicocyclus nassatus]